MDVAPPRPATRRRTQAPAGDGARGAGRDDGHANVARTGTAGGGTVKLEGFRCDLCGVESREKKGTWTEVRSLRISDGGWSASPLMSDGLHYCSHACLLAAIETKWVKDR